MSHRVSEYFTIVIFGKEKGNSFWLGCFPELSLAQARQQCKEHAGLLKEGKDPKAEIAQQLFSAEQQQREDQLKGSIEQLILGYTTKMRDDGKRTWQQVLYRLEKETYPFIPKATKARDVTHAHIKQFLATIIQRGASVEANRVRSYLMAAFNSFVRPAPTHASSIALSSPISSGTGGRL